MKSALSMTNNYELPELPIIPFFSEEFYNSSLTSQGNSSYLFIFAALTEDITFDSQTVSTVLFMIA